MRDLSSTSKTGLTASVKPYLRRARRRSFAPILTTLFLAVLFVLLLIPRGSTPSDTPINEVETIIDPVTKVSNETNTVWFFNDFDWLSEVDYLFAFVLEVNNCSGSNGTVTYTEHEGNHLGYLFYTGDEHLFIGFVQSSVNGWEGFNESWYGLGNCTRDYRAGNWTPAQGIEFVHSTNQSFGDAELIVLAYTAIPEFSAIGVVIVMFILMAVLIKRRKT